MGGEISSDDGVRALYGGRYMAVHHADKFAHHPRVLQALYRRAIACTHTFYREKSQGKFSLKSIDMSAGKEAKRIWSRLVVENTHAVLLFRRGWAAP